MPLLDNTTRMAMLNKQFGAVNYTPTANYYVAAVTRVPDDEAGSGLEEPSDVAYSRITVPNNTTYWEISGAGTEIVNKTVWEFDQAGEDWGVVYGIALFDNSSNYMGFAPFGTAKFVQSERILRVRDGAFMISPEDTPLSVLVEETPLPPIFTAPNGNRYAFSVSNAGAAVFTSASSFGPPSAPTSLINTSGVLSWTATAHDGGSPVVSYTIWTSDADTLLVGFDVVDSSTLSYDTDGATGTFFVTADNVYGPSAASNEVTI